MAKVQAARAAEEAVDAEHHSSDTTKSENGVADKEEVKLKEEKEKLEKEDVEAGKKTKGKPGSGRKTPRQHSGSASSKSDMNTRKQSQTPLIVLESDSSEVPPKIYKRLSASASKFYEIPEDFAPYVR